MTDQAAGGETAMTRLCSAPFRAGEVDYLCLKPDDGHDEHEVVIKWRGDNGHLITTHEELMSLPDVGG